MRPISEPVASFGGEVAPQPKPHPVGALVLAAGLSTRMGQAKQLMRWHDRPMVTHVVETLIMSGVEPGEVVVVVGHQREEVAEALRGSAARTVFNPLYAEGSMLRSLQVGLQAFESLAVAGVLVALSDQPQMKPSLAAAVIERWRETGAAVVAPSYKGRRGHPILFDRTVWPEVLAAPPVGSPRAVLMKMTDRVDYLVVDDDSVLLDIDTPDDYARASASDV